MTRPPGRRGGGGRRPSSGWSGHPNPSWNRNPGKRGLKKTIKAQKKGGGLFGCLLILVAVASVAFAVAEALFLRSVS